MTGPAPPADLAADRPAKESAPRDWFRNCEHDPPHHDMAALEAGIDAGWADARDRDGLSALALAAASGWAAGVRRLAEAGADPDARHHRTGETALLDATREGNAEVVAALLAAGADPDAANHHGLTPRRWDAGRFRSVPEGPPKLPPPRIQNAEHLAEHYHESFEIPDRGEREGLRPGRAVDVWVFGPQAGGKSPRVKCRITHRTGFYQGTRYTAEFESPPEATHLPPDVRTLEFGPEHVASVYVPRPN